MDFQDLIRTAESTGCNLYDMALYTEEGGIQTHRFQPCANANNSYSVAKAFVVTAIGMLRDENRIRVTDRFADLFSDELPEEADPGWQTATVEHAMTHCLGFDEGFLDIDVEDMGEFMEITSWNPTAWKISTTSDMQMTPLQWQKEKRNCRAS